MKSAYRKAFTNKDGGVATNLTNDAGGAQTAQNNRLITPNSIQLSLFGRAGPQNGDLLTASNLYR